MASLNISYLRQGEGRVIDEWTEPWLSATGDYSEPFPTGTVEKTASLSLGVKGYLKSVAGYDLQAGVDRVSNLGHTSGDNRTIPFLRLTLSATFSTIIDAR